MVWINLRGCVMSRLISYESRYEFLIKLIKEHREEMKKEQILKMLFDMIGEQ